MAKNQRQQMDDAFKTQGVALGLISFAPLARKIAVPPL